MGVVLAMMVAGLLFLYARMAQQTMYAESSQYLNEVSLQMAAAIEKHCISNRGGGVGDALRQPVDDVRYVLSVFDGYVGRRS